MPAGVGQRVALIATVLIVSGMLVDIQGGILQPLVGIIPLTCNSRQARLAGS